MTSRALPVLSKSRLMAAAQCPKQLWLRLKQNELRDPLSSQDQAIMETGRIVGEYARSLYPKGVLIEYPVPMEATDEERWAAQETMALRTAEAMQDRKIKAIFEATFLVENTLVRVDLLVRDKGNTWKLYEVKSSTTVEPEHLVDAAIQRDALTRAGVTVTETALLMPDPLFVWDGKGKKPWAGEALAKWPVTEEAILLQEPVRELTAGALDVLTLTEAPDVAPDPERCKLPRKCPFYSHCHPHIAADDSYPIESLPRIHKNKVRLLRHLQLQDVRQLSIPLRVQDPERFPEELAALFPLKAPTDPVTGALDLSQGATVDPRFTTLQQRVIQAVQERTALLDDQGVVEAIREIQFPLHFLDFETYAPAIPMHANTSPYQPMAFQWSLHTLRSDGRLYHQEYLHQDETDPRAGMLKHLLRALDDDAGTICVWSPYENTQLKNLAEAFPEQAEAIEQVRDRLLDLLPVVRRNFYHPDFGGSFSVKKVLPVMAPGLTYDDLEIQNGAQAQDIYLRMFYTETTVAERRQWSQALLKYCERDTEAMVRIWDNLIERLPDDALLNLTHIEYFRVLLEERIQGTAPQTRQRLPQQIVGPRT